MLLTKLKDNGLRLRYAAATVEHGWSRHILTMQIEAKAVERQGKAVTNFDRTLPAGQSDLAREPLKDPYKLDFLGLEESAREREIEQALAGHVADFLIELGAGFAYVGRQVHLEVGGEDFKPEHVGQLGFYMTAIDAQVKHEHDAATIGLVLCKT